MEEDESNMWKVNGTNKLKDDEKGWAEKQSTTLTLTTRHDKVKTSDLDEKKVIKINYDELKNHEKQRTLLTLSSRHERVNSSDKDHNNGKLHSGSRQSVTHSKNIVYHLLLQQVGRNGAQNGTRNGALLLPPNYKLATERIKNRELLASRIEKWSGDPDDKVSPTFFELPLENSTQNKTPRSNWIQFTTLGQRDLQIDVVDKYIWTSCYDSDDANGQMLYTELFYTFDAPEFHFKITEKRKSHGCIVQTEKIKNQGPRPNEASDFLISLDDTGTLKAFDLEKGSTTTEIQLKQAVQTRNHIHFKQFAIRQDEQEILVFGSDKEEKTRAILILHFPPWWNSIISIIYISDNLSMNVMMQDDYCFIEHGASKLMVTAWTSILETITPFVPTSDKSKYSLDVETEWTLTELPTRLVQISMPSKIFEFYNFFAPMIHMNCKELGNQLYTIFPTSKNGKRQIFRLDGIDDDLGGYESLIIPFPDKTPRLIITNTEVNVNREVVLTFKRTKHNGVMYEKTFPFQDPENQDPESSAYDGDTRIQSQCVIAIDYCQQLDLMAVLLAKRDTFQVKLYHAATLKFFLALPIIMRESTSNHDVSNIDHAQLYFNHNFIVVNILFKKQPKQVHQVGEVYFGKLMSTYNEE